MSATTATTRLHLVSHSSLPSPQLSSRPCFLLLPFAIPLFPSLPRPVSSSFIPYPPLSRARLAARPQNRNRFDNDSQIGPSLSAPPGSCRPRAAPPFVSADNIAKRGRHRVRRRGRGRTDRGDDRPRPQSSAEREENCHTIHSWRKKCLMIGPSARK